MNDRANHEFALAARHGMAGTGEGRVARGPHGAIVVSHDGDAGAGADLIALVAGADDDSGPPDGQALVWAVAARLVEAGASAPSFSLVAEVGDALAVIVGGRADVVVRRGDAGPLSFAGGESVTWVDRLVTEPIVAIDLGVPGAVVPDGAPTLSAGVMEGDRLRLTDEIADEASSKPEPDTESQPDTEPEPTTSKATVQGVLCENGHFNHPLARYCRIDGVAMIDGGQRVESERPALGVFVRGDGSTFTVEDDIDVGRRPEGSEAGRPVLHLDHETVAPVHAEVLLVGWDVTLHDLGTGHATWHWPLGGEAHRVPAGQAVTLTGGDRIAIGHYELRFESHHL